MAWSEKKIDGDTKIAAESSVGGELFVEWKIARSIQLNTILGDLKASSFPYTLLDLYVALIPT